jgi:transcriptional regulator of heat shock response
MNKMLKDKYSLPNELMRGNGQQDLEVINNGVRNLLENLRFNDGRSLKELLEEMKRQKALREQEERMRELAAQEQAAAIEDEASSEDRNDSAGFSSAESFLSGSDSG